jgi:hypothetical protein
MLSGTFRPQRRVLLAKSEYSSQLTGSDWLVWVDACGAIGGAQKAHIGVGLGVPTSVPKRDPRTIIRQPTPTKVPTKNGPEIVDFRPVL